MAPEIINLNRDDASSLTPKCDVFSIGVIFYKMLTGYFPFSGKTVKEVVQSNKKAAIDFNSNQLALVFPEALSLLRGMLEIKPEMRLSANQCLQIPNFY